ncbi:MarR family winged helix-turn-helix transcriptional regulator [Spirochaeta isovalerica]|uniref:DNA-binding MarR family transcriptional regulator n=1 Tax=Spirochaeta isovalerica TaxID=150 RepID=A0A841RBS7_9SPIO|nr:MarR family transcriptional regulator [Spirochaeta isovalerica]MBB6481393.1 DNA-binding MarR family transcriptional regulator [Spirochaeta isovalerica]
MDQTSQDLSDSVVSTLRQIIRAIDLHSKKLTKRYGLTGPQLIVLKEINKSPSKPISEIAKNVSLSQATVTSILDRLGQQGFTIRQRSDKDKRKVSIVLTDKAKGILDLNPSLLQEDFTGQFDKLKDWEKNMLLSSLQRLATMMDASNIESQPILASGPLSASPSDVKRYLEDEINY